MNFYLISLFLFWFLFFKCCILKNSFNINWISNEFKFLFVLWWTITQKRIVCIFCINLRRKFVLWRFNTSCYWMISHFQYNFQLSWETTVITKKNFSSHHKIWNNQINSCVLNCVRIFNYFHQFWNYPYRSNGTVADFNLENEYIKNQTKIAWNFSMQNSFIIERK